MIPLPTPRSLRLSNWLLAVPPLAAAGLFCATLRHREWNEPWFVYSTYYVLFVMVMVYAGVRISSLADGPPLRLWIRENLAGLVTTALVCTMVFLAVAPAYRVLADEANLVGVSKNLFFYRTANLAVSGKWYFESYWNLGEVTDRRPALFPFFVSLLHVVRGYHAENAFHVNAILFVLFVFCSYRLAKRLGGEVFGIAAAVLVAASPTTLVSARSAGFDFFATFLLLVIVRSFHDYVTQPSPRRLAILTLDLCLLAHVRYEGGALLGLAALLLFGFRTVRWSHLRGFGLLYSVVPLFLLPRYWQAVAKADDAEQPLTAKLFGISHFLRNAGEYLRMTLRPLEVGGAHSPLIAILGIAGCALLLIQLAVRLRKKALSWPQAQFAIFVAAALGAQSVLYFSYMQGEPLQPASARLFMWLDTFLAFAAAWILAAIGHRIAASASDRRLAGAMGAVLASAVLFATNLPAAIDARFIHELILTRQAAAIWRFFDKLGDKGILILSDRPGLYTIMDYGSLDISLADGDRSPLYELSRHLYRDIYLVQEVDLETHKPLPAFDAWPDVEKETVFEFQNTDSTSVRIARIKQ